ncbi:DUF1883 domain-containing protein [Hafnia alvei]|uniref:DUF1883 domain-containing protein n=2 Tax=Hafnia TaxID=568 RepID=UPI002AB2B872|nr:DUF1883 domain-containing protein [Hafnia alvei]
MESHWMKHKQLYLTSNSYVKVVCSEPAKVLLINDKYYDRFSQDSWPNYHGGFFSYFPAIIEVPYEGIWNIVIEPHLTGRSLPTIGLTVIPRDDNQISD